MFGRGLHTLNLRLSSDQLAFIINHAEDKVIFVDASLVPLLECIRDQIPCVKHFVVLEDVDTPENHFSPLSHYEALLAEAPEERFAWPDLDENAASATCYTSGTTGNPKGVLYSHRSMFLHSMAMCWRTSPGCASATPFFRWSRCSTPTAGGCRTPGS